MATIKKTDASVCFYYYEGLIGEGSIKELKEWCDYQMKMGSTEFTIIGEKDDKSYSTEITITAIKP